MTDQYQYIRDAIRAGETLPSRWPEPGEPGYEPPVQESQDDGPAPTRWWEQEGLTMDDFPPLRGGRR